MAGDIRGLLGLPNAALRQFEFGGAAVVGQPVRVRTWGIPTAWLDRVGKWNFWREPIRKAGLLWQAILGG